MRIESQIQRRTLLDALATLTPDIAVSLVFLYFTESALISILVFFGIQIASLALWAKGLMWSWLVFYNSGKEQMKKAMVEYLNSSEFPQPPDYIASPQAYLTSIADDDELPVKVRLRAARDMGFLSAAATHGKGRVGIMISIAMEEALVEFKRNAK